MKESNMSKPRLFPHPFQPFAFLVIFGHFCLIFASFLCAHGRPLDPSTTSTVEMLSLGFSSTISMSRKPLKVHHKPLSSVTTCHVVVKTDYVTFSMFVHSHGPPHDTFSFFLSMMWWLKYSGTDFRQEVGIFFIIFHYFLPIFAYFPNFWIFSPFCPF